MDRSLVKIKLLFSSIIVGLVAITVLGGFAIRGYQFLNESYIYQTVKYANHKLSFAFSNNSNMLAIASMFLENRDLSTNKVSGSGEAKSIPALVYHRITDDPGEGDTTIEKFRDQMFTLKKNGWQTISTEDLYYYLLGEKKLPEKSFLLTFDDGTKDSFYPVDPLLKALDYNAVSFIISKYSVGNKKLSGYYLSEKELEGMLQTKRWELQSHGKDDHDLYLIDPKKEKEHFLSNKLWIEREGRIENEEEFKRRIRLDLVNSKNNLEGVSNSKVIGFAYPFGDYGQRSVNFPEAKSIVPNITHAIYDISFHQVENGEFTQNYMVQEDLLMARRIGVKPEWNGQDLLSVLEGGNAKSLPYEAQFQENDGWLVRWGERVVDGEKLKLSASTEGTGALVTLDGSLTWENYKIEMDAEWKNGHIFLHSGLTDTKTYRSCVFSNGFVTLRSTVDGETKIIDRIENENIFPSQSPSLFGLKTIDGTTTCLFNNKDVLSASDLSIHNGGVGIQIWNEEVGTANLIVNKFYVRQLQ